MSAPDAVPVGGLTAEVVTSLEALADVGRRFDARGWVPATSGNFSIRDPADPRACWITASGRHKGRLTPADFVRVDLHGQMTHRASDGARPSAETSLHVAVYRHVDSAQAVLHVHDLSGTLASRRAVMGAGASLDGPGGRLALPNVELLKAFDLWDEAPNVGIDVFANHPAVPDIAAEVEVRLEDGLLEVPGFLIRDHGLTAWGSSLVRAENAVEAFEFIFKVVNAGV